MYCNFTKSQAFPFALRVSSQPICFSFTPFLGSKSQLLRIGCNPKASENFRSPYNGFAHKTLRNCHSLKPVRVLVDFHHGSLEHGNGEKAWNLGHGICVKNSSLPRARSFSSLHFAKADRGNGVLRNGKTLPWRAAAHKVNGGQKVQKSTVRKNGGSSWEESARNFLEKSVTSTVESKISKNRMVSTTKNGQKVYKGMNEVESEEEDVEIVNDDGNRMVRNGKSLPWLATAHKVKEERKIQKATIPKTSDSSLAGNFLRKNGNDEWESKNGKNKLVELVGNPRNDYWVRDEEVGEGEEEEEEDDDVANADPRWEKIKNRVSGLNAKSGFENPEFRRWNKQENWGRKTWKDATESTGLKMVGEGIYGVGPVLAALSAGRREFYTLYVQEGLDLSRNNRKKKVKKGYEKVLRLADKIGLSLKESSKHDLNMVVGNRPHQGLVLDASPLEMVGIKELEPIMVEEENGPIWLALDEVMDPQNLGAIIRSAYFFGASGVVLCAKNSAPLSGVVSKASAGSLEVMEVRSCKNMMKFLASSAENGWRVLGGSVWSKAIPLDEVLPGAPTILVLGSEGSGLRPLVERSCTHLVRIPGNIPVDVTAGEVEGVESAANGHDCTVEEFRSFLAVESLNVSVAAGVLLHHLSGNSHGTCGNLREIHTEALD